MKNLLLIGVLFLSGCSLFQTKEPEPIIIYKPVKIQCTVNKPSGLDLINVTFNIIQDPEGTNWISLDGDNYKNLVLNNGKLLRYIKDMIAYSEALNDCIVKSGETNDTDT